MSERRDHGRDHEALVERVVTSTIGLFELAGLYLGDRLGLYRALHDARSRDQRAAGRAHRHRRALRARVARAAGRERAARASTTRRRPPPRGATRCRPATPRPLVDPDGAAYIAPLARQALGMLAPAAAARGGVPKRATGSPTRDYGPDTREGIADLNRAMFINELGSAWFPSIDDVHARLDSPPGACVADLGCGSGWSSIAIARAYPHAFVDGIDSDAASIETARANARAEGLDGSRPLLRPGRKRRRTRRRLRPGHRSSRPCTTWPAPSRHSPTRAGCSPTAARRSSPTSAWRSASPRRATTSSA